MQNIMKFKNKDMSGVFAVQCARHQFFEPAGMVDLQKGKRHVESNLINYWVLTTWWLRYCNSDYTLASVLDQYKDLPHICWSYDIECQHGVNRISRFKEWFPDLVPVVQQIVGCIPKMHISNHKDDCMYIHSAIHLASVAHVGRALRQHGLKPTKPLAAQRKKIEATATIH